MYFPLLLFTFSLLTSLAQNKLSGLYLAVLWYVQHHYISSASTMTDQVSSACSYVSVLKWWVITSDRPNTAMGGIKGWEKRWKWQCRALKALGIEISSNNNLYINHIFNLFFFREMQYHKLEAVHSAHICGLWFRNFWQGEIIILFLPV